MARRTGKKEAETAETAPEVNEAPSAAADTAQSDAPASPQGDGVSSAQDETPPDTEASDDGAVIVVTAHKPRRRAGRRFGSHETRIPISELSESDALAIRDDPLLTVRVEQPDED